MARALSATPAIAAPSQPSKHRLVTIAPAIITPARIDRKEYLNFRPSRKAAIQPGHAPVTGRGIATNRASPIFSYLSMLAPRFLVCLKTQSTNFCPAFTWQTALVSGSKNSRSIGTGNKLPVMARQKALCHGIWNKFMATGKPTRSSATGKADMMTIHNSWGMFQPSISSIMILVVIISPK